MKQVEVAACHSLMDSDFSLPSAPQVETDLSSALSDPEMCHPELPTVVQVTWYCGCVGGGDPVSFSLPVSAAAM